MAPTVPVRLAGSGRAAEGRLEVYRGGEWGLWAPAISSANATAVAEVVCRQLGYTRSAWMQANIYHLPNAGQPQWQSVNCHGNETSVLDCTAGTWMSYGYGGTCLTVACGSASGGCLGHARAGHVVPARMRLLGCSFCEASAWLKLAWPV